MPGTALSTGNSGMNETNNHCPFWLQKEKKGKNREIKKYPFLKQVNRK